MTERKGPIPHLADLKQTSFASTLDSLSRRGQTRDDEGFVMAGYGIKKTKKKKLNKREKELLRARRGGASVAGAATDNVGGLSLGATEPSSPLAASSTTRKKPNVTFSESPTALDGADGADAKKARNEGEEDDQAAVRMDEDDEEDDDEETFAQRTRKDADESEKAALLRMRFNSRDSDTEGDDDDEEDEEDTPATGHYDVPHHSRKSLGDQFGEYMAEMGEDLKANLGYMKDSLLTKEGWLLTLKRIKADWRAAGTVGLVNLPLSISLAVAANSGPVPGTL